MDYQNVDEEVKELAQEVIDDWHPHLSGIPIEYVFCLDEIKEKGKLVLGRARKKTGLDAFLRNGNDEEFFVIELFKPYWVEMGEATKKALLDHELSHCKTKIDDGDLKLFTVSHDLEEFREVVERHGLWQPDLVEFVKSLNRRRTGAVGGLFDTIANAEGFDSLSFQIPGEEEITITKEDAQQFVNSPRIPRSEHSSIGD